MLSLGFHDISKIVIAKIMVIYIVLKQNFFFLLISECSETMAHIHYYDPIMTNHLIATSTMSSIDPKHAIPLPSLPIMFFLYLLHIFILLGFLAKAMLHVKKLIYLF